MRDALVAPVIDAMGFPSFERLSPNCDAAPRHEQRGVLLHHSVSDFETTIGRMLQPESKVSYHALIAADGTRCTLVPDDRIAWHAGVSTFRGRTRCNDFLLGLAFAGDTYQAPLTTAQIESAVEWLEPRWTRQGWSTAWITDHRQVSPGRKDDLNPTEWERVIAAVGGRFEG